MTAVRLAVPTAVLATASYAVWREWRAHAGRQAELPEPQWLDGWVTSAGPTIDGTYISTTTRGRWLDRVIAPGLGTLSRASVATESDSAPDAERGPLPPLLILRRSARGFKIPAEDLLGARCERGIGAMVRRRNGIIVIRWRLGDHELHTGFRPYLAAEGRDIEQKIEFLRVRAHHA
ncbi:MAG: hypothetical protein ACR2LE_01220 [Nocardioidaceae bacterium]